MKIAVGADHAAYGLKAEIIDELGKLGHEVKDYSPAELNNDDDYPDIASLVANAVASREAEFGVLMCGTGIGVSIAANKIQGVRAALCGDTFSAHCSREHNNANVLCLGARVTGSGLARDILRVWLETRFINERRHVRRVEKMMALEPKKLVPGQCGGICLS